MMPMISSGSVYIRGSNCSIAASWSGTANPLSIFGSMIYVRQTMMRDQDTFQAYLESTNGLEESKVFIFDQLTRFQS